MLKDLQETVNKISVIANKIQIIKDGRINEVLANDPEHMCWVAEVKEEMRLKGNAK